MTTAIVIGSGFSGWLAAIALEQRCDRVILIERDHDPTASAPRRGVPQGTQLHNLLGRASLHLDQLVPGFTDALVSEGCGVGGVSTETDVNELGVDMPHRPVDDLRLFSVPRPTIDRVLSRFAQKLELLDGADVTGIAGTHERVTGVICSTSGVRQTIECDIVVDASGPASISTTWLASIGISVPLTTLDVDQWYVSTTIRLRPGLTTSKFAMSFPYGTVSAGALLSPLGDGTHHLSASGRSRDPVPATYIEMLEHVASLTSPTIKGLVAGSSALTEPRRYRKLVAKWHRFDKVTVPNGLAVIGDSHAALNPLFGQGMSVAAWQIATMLELMTNHRDWSQQLAERSAEIVQQAWTLGRVVEESLSWDSADGESVDLTDALAAEILADPQLHRRYVRMWHLLESPDFLSESQMTERLLERHGRSPS